VWTARWKIRAVLRRHQVDALQLVFGRHPPLGELGALAADLGQLLADLGAQILVDLQDLELDLGDASLGLGDRGGERTALAVQARRVALEGGHAVERHQVLLPQAADAAQLLLVPVDLLGLGRHLLVVADDLLAELVDLLEELRLLALARRAAQLEQALLALHCLQRPRAPCRGR
jgi:hypothetical protein